MDYRKLICPEDEKPLEKMVTDGGFVGIFRTIACVGDSLSSGEFESVDEAGVKHYHDMFEYSWGAYMARAAGCTVYNFSRGGMTAKEYCESFAKSSGLWEGHLAAQAYIIALGVNDLMNQHMEPGRISDIDFKDWRNNKETFIGYYAQIIQRYREIQPEAKFFLMTAPKGDSETRNKDGEDLRRCVLELAEAFENCYVLDFWQYAPVHDGEFRELFYLGGHLNPCGYVLTAQQVMSYIDYIIRHNMADFKEVGFIGQR